MSGDTWSRVHPSQVAPGELVESGEIEVAEGEGAEFVRVVDLFDRYDPSKAVVVPPALMQDRM